MASQSSSQPPLSATRVALPKHSTFVRSALLSGLVSQQHLDQAIEKLRAQGGLDALPAVGVSEERIAAQLVDMELLTAYQCQQLKAGRTKLNLGPYLITDWLGQGGMGQVFVAVHQMMHRQVAIKVLPKSKSTPDAIASFTREIQTQAKLDHRNLVRAYDAGHDGNVYFLVTEYVPGTDLRRLVRSQGRLTIGQGAAVIRQAALGLSYAHEQGLVHRDVKPGNLLVTPEGLVKVSDLGLAGFLHEGVNDPRAGKIVGTADYLAPEKITKPHWVSAVSDIYSLGCTLYYAITGKVPFPGGSTREKARRHCEETPWHPRQFNPEVTDDFVDLIADMMEKDPARRIQTAAEVAMRLESWIAPNPTKLPQPQGRVPRWSPPPIPSSGRDETQEELTPEEMPGAANAPAAMTPVDSSLGLEVGTRSAPSLDATFPAPPLPTVHVSAEAHPVATQAAAIRQAVFRALLVAIPLAMLTGGLLTYAMLSFLR